MGWGMWLLMLAGTVAFWGVILLGLRALLEVREEDGAAQPEQAMDPPASRPVVTAPEFQQSPPGEYAENLQPVPSDKLTRPCDRF